MASFASSAATCGARKHAWTKIFLNHSLRWSSTGIFKVFDWNQPSIDFYKRRGAVDLTNTDGKLLFQMNREQMQVFVSSQWVSEKIQNTEVVHSATTGAKSARKNHEIAKKAPAVPELSSHSGFCILFCRNAKIQLWVACQKIGWVACQKSVGLHAKNRLGCMPQQPGTKTVDLFTKSHPGCLYRTSSGAHIQIALMHPCVPNHTSGKQKAASRWGRIGFPVHWYGLRACYQLPD